MYRPKFRQPSIFGCSTRLFQSSRPVGFPCLTNSTINILHHQTNAPYTQSRLPASPSPSSTIRKYSTNQDPHPSSAASSKLPCSRCKRKFANREALDMHVKIKHAKKLSCDKCDKLFKSQSDLDKHYLGKHGSPEFQSEDSHSGSNHTQKVSCGKCDRTFKTQDDLDKHSESKHSESKTLSKEFLCGSCQINFANKSALERHYASNHKRKISCDKCEKLFKTQDDFDKHTETKHGNQKFRCGECTRTFIDQEALDEHVKSSHTKPDPHNDRFKALFERRARLDVNFESEYNDTYRCEECNIVFGTQKEMMSHDLTEHFGCEIQGVGSHEEQAEFLCQLDSYAEFIASQMHPGGFQELFEDDMSWNYPDDWDYYDIWKFRGGDEDYEEEICGDDEETIERLKNLRRSQAMLREGDEWGR